MNSGILRETIRKIPPPFITLLNATLPVLLVLLFVISVFFGENFALSPEFQRHPAVSWISGLVFILLLGASWGGAYLKHLVANDKTGSIARIGPAGVAGNRPLTGMFTTLFLPPLVAGLVAFFALPRAEAIILHDMVQQQPFNAAFTWLESDVNRGRDSVTLVSTQYGTFKFSVNDAVQQEFSNTTLSVIVEGNRSWFGIRADRLYLGEELEKP